MKKASTYNQIFSCQRIKLFQVHITNGCGSIFTLLQAIKNGSFCNRLPLDLKGLDRSTVSMLDLTCIISSKKHVAEVPYEIRDAVMMTVLQNSELLTVMSTTVSPGPCNSDDASKADFPLISAPFTDSNSSPYKSWKEREVILWLYWNY